MSNYDKVEKAIRDEDLELVKELLKDDTIDLGLFSNKAIRIACSNNNNEIIKLLLKRKDVDPSNDGRYSAIKNAFDNSNLEIVRLLLKDKRVVKTLEKEDINKYRKYTSELKENIILALGLTVFGLILSEIV